MKTSLTTLDFVVIVAYLAGTSILGIWLGRKKKDAQDYFIARGSIPWWAVLVSVVATETSALTFISIPGLAYIGNLGFLQVAAGYLLGRIVVSYTLLPKYFEGELVTAYAFLERRFGGGTRRFASVTFMVTRAFGDSVRVFATAIPVALILGPIIPAPYLMPAAVLILGLVTFLYTYEGGMRAVIWTDVLQTLAYLVAGIAAIYLLGQAVSGGWSSIIAQTGAEGKLQLIDLYTGFDKPHTLFAGLIGGAFLSMATHGADQLIVQRLLAAGDLKSARKALIWSGVAVIAQFTLFLFIGLGLYVYYTGRTFAAPDSIFPTFVLEHMPGGLRGLVVAAILAASTFSGALNSLSAAATHDIYLPLTKRSANDPRALKAGKLFTLMWAVILIAAALLYRQQGTPVVVVALSIASFTYGGLLGGFFLGLFWDRATQRDAIVGMASGIAVMTFVVFAKQLGIAALSGIAWPWYVLIGTSVTMLIGIISSLTHSHIATTK